MKYDQSNVDPGFTPRAITGRGSGAGPGYPDQNSEAGWLATTGIRTRIRIPSGVPLFKFRFLCFLTLLPTFYHILLPTQS
jgi:hypothetical protein